MFTLQFHLSYQDQVCYDVLGHDTVRQIELYSASLHTIAYMRSTFNHNGDSTSFERNILSRQGGAVIRSVHSDRARYPYRWTPEVYRLFVGELYRMRAGYLQHHAQMAAKYGADWPEVSPMDPVPVPMYFDLATRRFETEPWFDVAMTQQAA